MAFSSENVEVFLAVIDHGSFSAAARALKRVPSAISMSVAGLEAELGIDLFDRSGREPKPTPAARALEPQARHVASQLKQLDAHALALSEGLERRLTLVLVPQLSTANWSEPLKALAEEFPLLEVEVLLAPQEDALLMLHSGVADLAMLFERPAMDPREGFQEIGQEMLIAVASKSHAISSARRLRAEDLLEYRQIAVGSRGYGHVEPRLVLSRRLWRTQSHLVTLGLVEAGLGWAYLPERLVVPLIEQGTLVKLAFANITSEVGLLIDVVWMKDRPLGLAARRYIDVLASASVGPASPQVPLLNAR